MAKRLGSDRVGMSADQAWYWTGSWQKGERAVDTHVSAGRIKAVSVDEFLAAIDKVRQNRG